MVLHVASVHIDDARSTVHRLVQVYLTIFQRHHDAGRLEGGAGFPQVTHGIVLHLIVFAISTARKVDDGLDVTCLHLHHHGNANLSVDQLFLQLAAQSAVGKVLNVDVDGGEQVVAVLGRRIDDGHLAVAHDDEVLRARLTAQDAVEAQLQSAFRQAAGIVEELADGTAGKSAVRFEAKQHLVGMESASIHALTQERQFLAGPILDIAGQLGIDTPRVLATGLAFEQALTEPLGIAVREDTSQALGYAVQVNAEGRIAESARLGFDGRVRVVHGKVHIEGILGHGA